MKSKYLSYNNDQIEELLSNFLIGSWSYSAVSAFGRHEKAFEMSYIYHEKFRKSASSVAGNAYHEALALFFNNHSKGVTTSIVEMEQIAFAYIDNIAPEDWRLQKTTPSVESCITKATKTTTQFINNFIDEIDIYMSEISEVIAVELRCDEWLTINGVDIPLPCHAYIDLVVRLKDGRIVIIDHKSKVKQTDDREISLTGGKQAMTYVKCLEAQGYKVDEVWYIENKNSKYADGSPQLKKFRIELTEDNRKLYEAMLYETLRRVIEAVSDPNHIYMINDSDNFVDIVEVYEFWTKTMIAEVDDFNILPEKQEVIAKRLKKIRDAEMAAVTPKAIAEFRKNASAFIEYNLTNSNMTNSEKIEHTLRTFGIKVQVKHDMQGYSSDTFLVDPSAGVKATSIMKHNLDIAKALDVSDVRIGSKLMVYDGKSYISIEAAKVRTKDLLFDPKLLEGEKLPIGVDNFGRTLVWDLNNHATPHVLVCGATGSGKSVSIKSTLEYAILAGVENIVIFDPKRKDFKNYKGKKGIRVYNDIEDIEEQMRLLVVEMENRSKGGDESKILIVFDEFADAVSASRSGKDLEIKEEVVIGFYAPKKDNNGEFMEREPKYQIKVTGRLKSLEENLKALLQKGRALGFRIIAATQRASVKVITGDAKVNFPVQICFMVPKEVDSKVVLDEGGAEMLAGKGDGLMKSPEHLDMVRFQGFYKP